MKRHILLPMPVKMLLNRLERAGSKAYAVGGCVRDSLVGRTPRDWDVSTSATPEEMMHIFSDLPLIPTGLRYGTITVFVGNTPYEMTTFRKDGPYTDGRRPDWVSFSKRIEEDLLRRDFTINAMAYHPKVGIVDPAGGQRDLEHSLLRTVGEGRLRFKEDALRILRLFRFQAELDFVPDAKAQAAAKECKGWLQNVSKERIGKEFLRILLAPYPARAMKELVHFGIVKEFLPEWSAYVEGNRFLSDHGGQVPLEDVLAAVEAALPDPVLRLVLFFHGVGRPSDGFSQTPRGQSLCDQTNTSVAIIKRALIDLRFSNKVVDAVAQLIKEQGRPILPTKPAMRRLLSHFGERQARRLLFLQMANSKIQHGADCGEKLEMLEKSKKRLEALFQKEGIFTLKNLQIDGSNLIAIGVPPSPLMGKILEELLDWVLEDPERNQQILLLQKANSLLENTKRTLPQ